MNGPHISSDEPTGIDQLPVVPAGPAQGASDTALEVLHVALSALVQARIYADERLEWTGEVEAAIDRVSAYLGRQESLERHRRDILAEEAARINAGMGTRSFLANRAPRR